ncbi:helix-turn-helix domain-containing protein [Paenibacillus sp. 481]|uniref:helix-turn-helix domain-containing protein n=1 Tax=Paenibacillus sp. 481 TaxID=2835869 RepID=UPI001E4C07F7|nr:helix-turn-helix transcriptional regulator [Paenibacillus sp. 481]UHA72503.1 helix-turn-helix transcriptional regulator [Paenibacillus sp. 481]
MEQVHPMTILQYLALIHEVSYTHVCKEIGLTPQQFSDWVKKRRPVPKERLQAIADYFNMEPNLLIDENSYLQDLTVDKKIDIQIMFLKQLVQQAEAGADIEAYQDKLIRLEGEKEQQSLIQRFAAVVKQGNAQTIQLCETFVEQLESNDS